ncbi:esterase-like activity of phytase family protein [Paenibacillus sp. GCM10023252]|uniref:esterase-like activity of phytase family protein n=1 Tax=Paenibacillus sp. GCM10023252 TaxID=3252649 RepID=UPI003606B468
MKVFKGKRLLILAFGLGLAISAPVAQAADSALKAIISQAKVVFGDEELKLDKPLVNINGSLYVPVRAMGEALNKHIEWDAESKTATLHDYPFVTGKYEWKNPPSIGQGLKEGGFSGLVHLPGDPDNVFYTLADRGPNGQITIDKSKNRTFPVADYKLRFYKIEVTGEEVKVLETIQLKLPEGKKNTISGEGSLTGLSNIASDEKPYDMTGTKLLPADPDGLDLEGIAYSPSGDTFWLSDEYRPSVIQVKRDGTVLGRYVPQGDKAKLTAAGAQTPIFDTLPAVYAKRIANRGFEGVTISPDGKFLYASIQSPMMVPDKATGEASRNLRILKMDLGTKQVVGEYVYVAEDAKSFTGVEQKDVVISDIHALATDVLLVDERDKLEGSAAQIKRVYKIDLSKATNILGTKTSEALEGLNTAALAESKIVAASKSLILDLVKLDYPYEKFEGLTVVDKRTIAITNDNDFGIADYDDKGNLKFTGKQSQVWTIVVGEDLY